MIATQKAISYHTDSDDDDYTITHHFSALAIAASQLDVKVLQALVQGFSPKEKRAVLKELASYTPDYLSNISWYLLDKKRPKDLANLQKQKKEAFKIFLITLYKESREQISEEFFSSSFCFFQTARKIKISAAQKIIELKPHNTMTDEERDASKAGLLGKIMHRFN
jgi:hypothetical protein